MPNNSGASISKASQLRPWSGRCKSRRITSPCISIARARPCGPASNRPAGFAPDKAVSTARAS